MFLYRTEYWYLGVLDHSLAQLFLEYFLLQSLSGLIQKFLGFRKPEQTSVTLSRWPLRFINIITIDWLNLPKANLIVNWSLGFHFGNFKPTPSMTIKSLSGIFNSLFVPLWLLPLFCLRCFEGLPRSEKVPYRPNPDPGSWNEVSSHIRTFPKVVLKQ